MNEIRTGKDMKPKRTSRQARKKIQDATTTLRKKVFATRSKRPSQKELRQEKAALHRFSRAHNRMCANFILVHELGVTNPKIIRRVYNALERSDKKHGKQLKQSLADTIFKEKPLPEKLQMVRYSSIKDRIQAAQREAVCRVLGRKPGEKFFKSYIEKTEGIKKN